MLCAIYSHICCSLPTNAKLTTIEPHEIYDSVLILIVYVYVLTWKATYYSLFSMLWLYAIVCYAAGNTFMEAKIKTATVWNSDWRWCIISCGWYYMAQETKFRAVTICLQWQLVFWWLLVSECHNFIEMITVSFHSDKILLICHSGLNPCHDQDSNLGFRGHNA